MRSDHAKHGVRRSGVATQSLAARPASSVVQSGDGCAGASLTPDQENLAVVRSATLCLINRERAAQHETALRLNPDLQNAAQAHSESMSGDDYFEHTGPGGTVLERLEAAGYIAGGTLDYEIGENIAWGSMQDATPAAIVAAWMASPGHRANILNPDFRDTGIGISPSLPRSLGLGESGAMYTQDFGVVM